MQLLNVSRLPYHLVTLKLEHASIVMCNQGRHEFCFFLVGLALENVNRKLNQLVAMGRINVGGLKQRVAH